MVEIIDKLTKEDLIRIFKKFINQRPNFDLSNYESMKDYRADYREALKDKQKALILLEKFKLLPLDKDILKECFKRHDRLFLKEKKNGEIELEYIEGQYFPTEYRFAICQLFECYMKKVGES